MMKKELDLSGLKQVFSGLVIQTISAFLVGNLASGLMSGKPMSGLLSGIINIVALLMILAGLSKLRDASVYFAQAKRPFLIQLVLQGILFVILIVLGKIGWTVDSITGMTRTSIIEVLLLLIVLLAVWIFAMLFSVRTVLRGCGHVAEQANDPLFSIKCLKSWRLWYMAFLLTVLIMMAGMAVIVTVLRKTIQSGAEGQDLSQAIFTNITSSVLLVSVVGMAVIIFLFIVHVLYLAKVRGTYREYHLEEVVIPDPSEQKPVFADYVQRELEAAGYSAEFPEEEPDEDEDAVYMEEEGYETDTPELPDDGPEPVRKLYSGRKYRKVTQDLEEAEEDQDTEQIIEIAKLFRKGGKK